MESEIRKGFTTGSCSAAASKAAIYMLLSGREKNRISIETPAGITFDAEIVDIVRTNESVKCAVIKDGGSDPDITTGAHIVAEVSAIECPGTVGAANVFIDGGFGVGRVTKPGLDQKVGNAAINHVPREMIAKEVLEVCQLFDFHGEVKVLISVPEGEELAEKTFNPRLGIVGGISILGTSGIVEPMSSQALLDTIRIELNQRRALGFDGVAVSPGNYGVDFMKAAFDYDLDKSVKCSNFIGDTIDMASELGFKKLLLTGHIGKLIKVSGGVMNTHSKYGDRRMELLSQAAGEVGASEDISQELLGCVTTEEGVKILKKANICDETMANVMGKIMFYLNERAKNDLEVECMIYATEFGLLAASKRAKEFLWYIS